MSDTWGGRGDPAQGDLYNDRSQPGGTQPRRTNARPKLRTSVPMEAFPGESLMHDDSLPTNE